MSDGEQAVLEGREPDDEPLEEDMEASLDQAGRDSAEPGEEWIEEYESEKREKKPRRKVPHPVGIAVSVAVVLVLVIWTLLSPQVLPESGSRYVDSPTYANLGSYEGHLDIRWLLDLVHVAETTWGVSISGERNVSAGEAAGFSVLVTKVDEEMSNPWFVGTSIDLRKADMFVEDGPKVGSMVSESSEAFGPVAGVESVFDTPGNYSCFVFVEIAIYGKMIIGFVPVKVLRMVVDLEVAISVS